MSDTGLAAVHAAADSISRSDHEAAIKTAREQGRSEGFASGETLGLSAGAEAERARLAGIDNAALPGHEKLVAELKADASVTPGDAALRILSAERAKLAGHHDAIKAVEGATGAVGASVAATRSDPKPAAATTPDGWKAEFAASAKLQGEYGSAEEYANYQAGVASGRVKIFAPRA